MVQHIPPVFSAAFANRLNDLCRMHVKEAVDGDRLTAGRWRWWLREIFI